MANLPAATELDFVVDIPSRFTEYVDAALLRLGVLYPGCRFARTGGAVTARLSAGLSQDQARRAILHALYREKIYSETLAMRHALVAAVTA